MLDTQPAGISSVSVRIPANDTSLFHSELTKDSKWIETFTVPKTRMNGDKISCSVEEAPVPRGDTSTVTGDATSGFVITNTKEPAASDPIGPAKPIASNQPDTPDQPGIPDRPTTPDRPDDTPKTGDTAT